GLTRWLIVLQNAVLCYLLASIVAIAGGTQIGPNTSTVGLVGLCVINFLVVLRGSVHDRQKAAYRDGVPFDQFGTYKFDVAFSWLAAVLAVIGVFIPAAVVNPLSRIVVGAVLWVLAIPVVSWIIQMIAGTAVLGAGFMALILGGVALYFVAGKVRPKRSAAVDAAPAVVGVDGGAPAGAEPDHATVLQEYGAVLERYSGYTWGVSERLLPYPAVRHRRRPARGAAVPERARHDQRAGGRVSAVGNVPGGAARHRADAAQGGDRPAEPERPGRRGLAGLGRHDAEPRGQRGSSARGRALAV